MLTQLVIFDLDGTLIDSIGDLADAMNAVLDELGHSVHPRDDYRFLVGDGIEILVRRALPPEVLEETTIADVASQIRTVVLSNKPDFATLKIVGELFADDPFEIVRGARDGVPLKPDPTSALEIVSELGLSAARSVFVGDTPVDIKTGRNARIRTVGVTWGFREADELLESGADHIIDTPLELLEVVEGMRG
jgi:phosphoglycolate phosphatase